MTAKSEDYLEPTYSRSSMNLRVGFEPSPALNAGLQRFLIEEETSSSRRNEAIRVRRQLKLTSWISRNLPIIGSNNDGPIYLPSDAAQIAEDTRSILTINRQRLSIARQPQYALQKNGDMLIGLNVLPNEGQRRHLGKFILEEWQDRETLQIVATLPRPMLVPEARRNEALHDLAKDFALNHPSGHGSDISQLAVPFAGRMYVTNPHVVSTPNLHIV